MSWFEETPELSIGLIRQAGFGPQASIVDIGGSASRLVDALVAAARELLPSLICQPQCSLLRENVLEAKPGK